MAASGGCYDLVNYVAWEARVLVSSVNLVLRQGAKGDVRGRHCRNRSAPLRPGRLLLGGLMLAGRLGIVAVVLMFAAVVAKLRRG